jgi:Phosphoenolpyruvate-dependent sugar phosphotransferase system, EIIA 2
LRAHIPAFLDVEAHLGVGVSDVATLFSFVDGVVADGKRVLKGAVAKQLSIRQARGGTALGAGVVVPHAAIRRLRRARLVYVRAQMAIDMATPDHRPVQDALTLLVRYPPSLADLALLERIRDPHMCPILIDLLRRGLCAEAATHLAQAA